MKARVTILPLLALIFAATVGAEPPAQPALTLFDSKLKDGDLVFIESSSVRAPAIKELTGSDLTHCGIVFKINKKWMVYEGAGNQPLSEITEWQQKESGEGQKHHIYARRLKNRDQALVPHLQALQESAAALHKTPYDFGFAWYNKNGDGKEYIYCSELIWKAFHDKVGVDLNTPHPLQDYYLNEPEEEDVIRIKAAFAKFLNTTASKNTREGHGEYDPAELAISPKEVFDSPLLDPVTDDTP
jgi:hypothetical protein